MTKKTTNNKSFNTRPATKSYKDKSTNQTQSKSHHKDFQNLKNNSGNYFMFGKHACLSALSNPKRIIQKIYITDENLEFLPKNLSAKVEILNSKEISKLLPNDAIHQGFAFLVTELKNNNLESINFDDNTKLAILDQVTDPHNLGAILRTAAAFGISGIIIPNDNSPPESAIVAKTACGALELVPIYRVTNISSSINHLKKSNFWVIGLDGDTNETLNRKHFEGKSCIVLGAEGKGMRRLTRENCDAIVKIPIDAKMESLNVSNAASIAFYEAYLAKLNNAL